MEKTVKISCVLMLTLKLVAVQLQNFQQFQLADLNWNWTCRRTVEKASLRVREYC